VRVFKYRLRPKKGQITLFNRAVCDSRIVYNELLSTKIKKWKENEENLTQLEAQTLIGDIRKNYDIETSTVILRFAKDRLFDSYNHFFKKHNKFPRFKSKENYSSIGLYAGQYKLEGNIVFVPKVGRVKIIKDRDWVGTPKQIVIKKSPTNKWYLCICCEGDFKNLKGKTGKQVGIDLGLETFATISDGTSIPRERFFKEEEEKLAAAQSKNKNERVVARIHERIKFKRDNFIHQETKKLVDKYDGMVLEKLSSQEMTKNNFKSINKSIQDAAWDRFVKTLIYKASSAGKSVVLVDPAYTSQTCSGCGYVQKLELQDREYKCPRCGLVLSRDLNAARNIYRLGAASL
jgi:putative transposase